MTNPPTYVAWPTERTLPKWKSLLDTIVENSLARRASSQQVLMPHTGWPSLVVSGDEYKVWRAMAERSQKFTDPVKDRPPAERTRTATEQRARQRKECHKVVLLSALVIYLSGSHLMTMAGNAGFTIPLDLLDSVTPDPGRGRCPCPSHIEPSTAIRQRRGLANADVDAFLRLVDGPDRIGHHALGEMLDVLANEAVTIEHLKRNKVDLNGPEAQRLLRRKPLLSLHVDPAASAAAERLSRMAYERCLEIVQAIRRHHVRRSPAPPLPPELSA